MKRTCFGCKALESIGDYRHYCGLHYQFETIFNPKQGNIKDIKPLEECPKPKSTKQFFNLLLIKKNETN